MRSALQLFRNSLALSIADNIVAREFKVWADALGMPSAAEGAENGTRELLELGLSTLVFCDARETFMTLERGDLEGLILRADKLMFATPVEVTKQLEAHFQKQMQRIRDLTPDADDGPGKQIAAGGANGNSPAMPIPPAAAASPPSNGWRQNTASPLKQPSGQLR